MLQIIVSDGFYRFGTAENNLYETLKLLRNLRIWFGSNNQ